MCTRIRPNPVEIFRVDFIFLPIVLAMTTFGTIVTDVFLPRPLLFWRDSPTLDLSNQRRMVRMATPTPWPLYE